MPRGPLQEHAGAGYTGAVPIRRDSGRARSRSFGTLEDAARIRWLVNVVTAPVGRHPSRRARNASRAQLGFAGGTQSLLQTPQPLLLSHVEFTSLGRKSEWRSRALPVTLEPTSLM